MRFCDRQQARSPGDREVFKIDTGGTKGGICEA